MSKNRTNPPPDEKKQRIQKRKTDQKKPRVAAKGYRLPEPIPTGEILTDVSKGKWKIGKSVGSGGFGEIYLASRETGEPSDAKYVIKIEPHENGPLFSEMHFYLRVAKEEYIDSWMKQKKLKFLGMPKFIASGSHEYRGIKYRFVVIERFGDDLQKLFVARNRHFSTKTILSLGIKILDVLEYIHSYGYVHADIKASNLLLGYNDKSCDKIFLVDFGLACQYSKEYKPDPRKAHDGTIEFTSRDAHDGVPSRRGDLEILGYNMLQWSCGKLPWEDKLKNPNHVKELKNQYLSDLPKLMKDCSGSTFPIPAIKKYFEYVAKLRFEEEPDYNLCRQLLREGLKTAGLKDDDKLDFNATNSEPKTNRKKIEKRKPEVDDDMKNEKPLRTRRSHRNDPSPPSEITLLNGESNMEIEICKPTPQMLEVIEMRKRRENMLNTNRRKKKPANRRQTRSTENFNASPDLF